MTDPMVAALYVATGGAYFGLPGVDPWDEPRDARLYSGPHPIVAHPPCARWGRYWSGGPSAKTRRRLGDDGGCFAAALQAARWWGGVIEHPEASHAWRWFGLPRPPFAGGWVGPDSFGGWSCCVFQGKYGHKAAKATWLYLVGPEPPDLDWGRVSGVRLDPGFHSKEEREQASTEQKHVKRLSSCERLATPPAFRDILISLAESCRQ